MKWLELKNEAFPLLTIISYCLQCENIGNVWFWSMYKYMD